MSRIVLLCIVMLVVFHCDADLLPSPTDLRHEWLDPFTVNLSWSWQKPRSLPDKCDIYYDVKQVDEKTSRVVDGQWRVSTRNLSCSCLTKEEDSWTYSVQTIGEKCVGWTASKHKNITFNSQKPRAEVMRDLKCILDVSGMNCSWIPVHPSLNLTLFYRNCGTTPKRIKSLQKCDDLYSSGTRSGCYLKVSAAVGDVCILMETEIGSITLNKPDFEASPPELSVTDDGHHLSLTWTDAEGVVGCDLMYELCYTRCSVTEPCRNVSLSDLPHRMHYDINCRYEFKSRVFSKQSCMKVESKWSEPVPYGTNKTPGLKLTMAAVVIPILLFICITLSCYCFRKYSHIICPKMPDPSAIFKEMMMSGSKELKIPTDSQYKPVTETVDTCLITSKSEKSVDGESSSHLHSS